MRVGCGKKSLYAPPQTKERFKYYVTTPFPLKKYTLANSDRFKHHDLTIYEDKLRIDVILLDSLMYAIASGNYLPNMRVKIQGAGLVDT